MNHDYNDNIFNRSDCMPALFPAAYTFDEGDAKGIVENESCSFEIDTMLLLIDLVLFYIPFKSDHVYLHYSTYWVDRTNERGFSKRLSYQAAVELPIKSHYVNYPGNPLDLRMRF